MHRQRKELERLYFIPVTNRHEIEPFPFPIIADARATPSFPRRSVENFPRRGQNWSDSAREIFPPPPFPSHSAPRRKRQGGGGGGGGGGGRGNNLKYPRRVMLRLRKIAARFVMVHCACYSQLRANPVSAQCLGGKSSS